MGDGIFFHHSSLFLPLSTRPISPMTSPPSHSPDLPLDSPPLPPTHLRLILPPRLQPLCHKSLSWAGIHIRQVTTSINTTAHLQLVRLDRHASVISRLLPRNAQRIGSRPVFEERRRWASGDVREGVVNYRGRCWTLTFLIGGCEAETVLRDPLQSSAGEGCVGTLIYRSVAITLTSHRVVHYNNYIGSHS